MLKAASLRSASDRRPLVAIVDRDAHARASIERQIDDLGCKAVHHDSVDALLGQGEDPIALACLSLGDRQLLEHIGFVRARYPLLPIVVLAAQPSIEWAVEAMRSGANDFIPKPLDLTRLSASIARLLRQRAPNDAPQGASAIVGESAPMRELARHIERVASSDVVVCLRGETGTGKELVTRRIHELGPRRRGPFVAVNCAAIPSQLQESELFGHERGAFTGAVAARRGRFEQANGGTLFLDELGEMSPSTQAVLLRVLEERKVQRLGGTSEVPVDIRVICATHRDLEAEVAAGRFRQDLYFRLNVYRIDLPPLRRRLEDIPALVEHFLERAPDLAEQSAGLSAPALELLRNYTWPGNVRELQNAVRRAALSAGRRQIEPADLPPSIVRAVSPASRVAAPALEDDEPLLPFREIERRAILRAMKASGGNVEKAAKALGLSRATVYRRLVEFATSPAQEQD
jgi:DNA-binding NtrC family response regulator